MTTSRPLVSLIVPCRNESKHLPACLAALLAQDYESEQLEVLVVDGLSQDDSPRIAERLLEGAPFRHAVLTNERRTAPAAFNVGLQHARGEIVGIVSAHCALAPDYVSRCVEALSATGAEVVGGSLTIHGEGDVAEAIAIALSSPIGVGRVAYRTRIDHSGPVDTVPFGAYRREVFERVGGFDEDFVRNQDDEMNFRISRAGGVIWMDPSISSQYYGRPTLSTLRRQHFDYGLYKWLLFKKHRNLPSWRHWVPGLFVAGLVGSVAVSAIFRRPVLAGAVAAPYAITITTFGAWTTRRRLRLFPRVLAALVTIHTSYGSGFLAGIWKWRKYTAPSR